MKISLAMISFNGEAKIGKTLEAVKGLVDEMIIVDSHSIDKTVEIAKSYGATVYDEDWKGEGLQYTSVVEKCSGEWILLLDQDEVVNDKLKENIREILKENTHNIYRIKLINHCFGKFIYFGGKFYKNILFKKIAGKFNEHRAHASFKTEEKIGKTIGFIEHYTYTDIEDYMTKFNLYTSEGARARFEKGKKSGFFSIIFKPIFRFKKKYFFQLGFLDGMEGFILACLSAFYVFTTYSKLRELNKNEQRKV